MDINTFIAWIRCCPFLSEGIQSRLLSVAERLRPEDRAQIVAQLKKSAGRQNAILDEGLSAITGIERSIKRDVRTKSESEERREEQRSLPNFDE
jgi:hypothetical protein